MQIKVGSSLYPFPERPLELGDQRRLKREFGFVPGRDDLDPLDPDHLAAFLYAAMRQADPDTPAASLISRIDRVREIEFVGDDGKPLPNDQEGDAAVVAEDPPPKPAAKKSASS